MDREFGHDDVVDITLRFGNLSVSVSGPSSQTSQLVSEITSASSVLGSSQGYSERGSPARSSAPSNFAAVGETRAEIEASFPVCPQRFLDSASSLGSGTSDGRSRIQRAWAAGNWTKAVLQGRAGSPNRTPQLSLQPKVYVVLRADGLSRPACFRSSRSYWSALGGAHRSSVSHSFLSKTEARVYCEAAGFDLPEIQQ